MVAACTCPWHDPALQDKLSAATTERKAQYSSGFAATHEMGMQFTSVTVFMKRSSHTIPRLTKRLTPLQYAARCNSTPKLEKMDTEILRAVCRTAAAILPSREDQFPTKFGQPITNCVNGRFSVHWNTRRYVFVCVVDREGCGEFPNDCFSFHQRYYE